LWRAPAWTSWDLGNIRGMLRSMGQGETKKRLDVERIAGIKQAARIFLTIHGGSGTDDEDFRKAIGVGINIVHINTELRVAWRRGLENGLGKQPDEVVPFQNSAVRLGFRKTG